MSNHSRLLIYNDGYIDGKKLQRSIKWLSDCLWFTLLVILYKQFFNNLGLNILLHNKRNTTKTKQEFKNTKKRIFCG